MVQITVAAIALNQTPLDWTGNKTRILNAARQAGARANILCFPELCISGYGCEDLFFAPWVREAARRTLAELLVAPEFNDSARNCVALVGLPIEHQGKIYSAVAAIQQGRLLGITCKKSLANDGIHYEQRWFSAWPMGQKDECAIPGLPPCPIGDVWYDFDGISLGIEICHDAWVPERHSVHLAERGVQIICNPSASHFAFGKRAIREQLIKAASREHCEIYVYANLLGCEAGRAIYDGDTVIAVDGVLQASGERLTLGESIITISTIELSNSQQHGVGFFGARKYLPTRGNKFEILATGSELLTPELPTPKVSGLALARWDKKTGDELVFEEFSRAVSLGLYDYARKSGALRFTLSLSGGADSAACAVLVDIMRKRLVAADLAPEFATISTADLLTCAYQGTAQSSAATLASARAVAEGVNVKLLELDVQPLVDGYIKLAQANTKQEISWEKHDLALQNIQSRVRAPSIWLLANLTNSLLLTTANRSEAAVGYSTMDGDTSGGLAPIGGVDKHFIRAWLRWMQTSGPENLGSYPQLKSVNELAPSAELRPGGTQTDEGDLMPYEVLSALERAAVRYYRSPAEAQVLIENEFSERFALSDLQAWSKKFFALFFRSQWKRERYAPAFHLDDYSLDPKTWFRMPILTKYDPT